MTEIEGGGRGWVEEEGGTGGTGGGEELDVLD